MTEDILMRDRCFTRTSSYASCILLWSFAMAAFAQSVSDDYYNQGALDFSQTDVLAEMKDHPPLPKPEGSFDAIKPAFAAAGLYASELDPASLPVSLTGYYKLKMEYANNTDKAWVLKNVKQYEPGARAERPVTDQEADDHIANFKAIHKDPDTMTPQEWGICINQMASWNYTAIYNLMNQVEEDRKQMEAMNEKIAEMTRQIQELQRNTNN